MNASQKKKQWPCHELLESEALVCFIKGFIGEGSSQGVALSRVSYLVTRSVNEGDLALALPALDLAGVGSNGLRDASCFAGSDLGLPDEVQQRCL